MYATRKENANGSHGIATTTGSMGCQMRIKGLLLLVLCVLLTSIFYSLIGNEKHFGQIYDSDQLYTSIVKIKKVVVPAVAEKSAYYLRASRSSDISVKYLHHLGFTADPRLFPTDTWSNVSLPVFVTAIKTGEFPLIRGLVRSINEYYSKATLIVYDLNLDDQEADQVS